MLILGRAYEICLHCGMMHINYIIQLDYAKEIVIHLKRIQL